MSRTARKMAMRGLAFAVGAAVAASAAFAPANASHQDGPNAADTGYETIFDGTEASFQEWAYEGRGSFDLPGDGTMRSVAGGFGVLWYPVEEYGDFSLKMEWRDDSPVALAGNSGVFVRFPEPSGTGSFSCLNRPACGYEVQINDSPDRDPRMTGSIYGFQDVGADQANVTPRGTWNSFEIRVVGHHYTVLRNGEVINEYLSVPGLPFPGRPTDPGSGGRLLSGYIGLQAHGGANDVVSFRDIKIRELGPSFEVVRSYIDQAAALDTLSSRALHQVLKRVDTAERLSMGPAADRAVRAQLENALRKSGADSASGLGRALADLAGTFH